jgi:hypothetical protein
VLEDQRPPKPSKPTVGVVVALAATVAREESLKVAKICPRLQVNWQCLIDKASQ